MTLWGHSLDQHDWVEQVEVDDSMGTLTGSTWLSWGWSRWLYNMGTLDQHDWVEQVEVDDSMGTLTGSTWLSWAGWSRWLYGDTHWINMTELSTLWGHSLDQHDWVEQVEVDDSMGTLDQHDWVEQVEVDDSMGTLTGSTWLSWAGWSRWLYGDTHWINMTELSRLK